MGMCSLDLQALACVHSRLEASAHTMKNMMAAETIVSLKNKQRSIKNNLFLGFVCL